MDDRTNTIAGWVLGAGIVALGASMLTAELFHTERPHTMGYPIEGVVDPHTDPKAAAEPPIANLLAAADPAKGQQVFSKCAGCHTIDKGAPDSTGPNLWGILGKPMASVPSYAAKYSPALKGKGGQWDWESMSQWVKSPRDFIPNSKMTFAGVGKPEDRANLLAFLNTKSDGPLPLPAPQAAPAAGNPAEAAATNAAQPAGPAPKEPVPTEQNASRVAGEGAPNVSGTSEQTKKH